MTLVPRYRRSEQSHVEASLKRVNIKRDGYNGYQRYDHAHDGSDSHT